MRVILASKSPRRKELLEMIGVKFDIIVSDEEEVLEDGLTIEEQAKKLSYIKAKSVFDKTHGDRIIVGSDTMVVDNSGKIYGKPKDKGDAIKMLKTLQGDSHIVITGIAILIDIDGKTYEYVDYDIAKVYIISMSDMEIEKWVETGEAYDKAGSYAVQGKFGRYVEKIDGNFWTVMGLPIHKVYNVLKQYLDI